MDVPGTVIPFPGDAKIGAEGGPEPLMTLQPELAGLQP